MPEQELEKWTNKLKLFCFLHGGYTLADYHSKRMEILGAPSACKIICPLNNINKTCDSLMLWINPSGVVVERNRKDCGGPHKCVEWIKYV